MALSRRAATGVGLGLLLALAAAGVGLKVLAPGGCKLTEVASLAAPDRAHRAVLYGRSCPGATATTEASVLGADDALSGSGNIFSAASGDAETAAWDGPWAEIEWTGPEALTLRYDQAARVTNARNLNDWVQLRFVPVAR